MAKVYLIPDIWFLTMGIKNRMPMLTSSLSARSFHLFSCCRTLSPVVPLSASGSGNSHNGTEMSSSSSLSWKTNLTKQTEETETFKKLFLVMTLMSIKHTSVSSTWKRSKKNVLVKIEKAVTKLVVYHQGRVISNKTSFLKMHQSRNVMHVILNFTSTRKYKCFEK